MKVYRTRYSLLIMALLAISMIAATIAVIEAMRNGKASEVFIGLGTLVLTGVIIVGAMMTNYFIDDENKQLVISTFFGLAKSRVDIMKMKRVNKSHSIMSAPASSLKRICIEYTGGRFKNEVIISPYMQEDFLQELKKINPKIIIESL